MRPRSSTWSYVRSGGEVFGVLYSVPGSDRRQRGVRNYVNEFYAAAENFNEFGDDGRRRTGEPGDFAWRCAVTNAESPRQGNS
eukprot:15507064-Heterocapsa_arctica.AAC.1